MSFAFAMRGFRQTILAGAAAVLDYLSLDFKNGTYRQTRTRQNLQWPSNGGIQVGSNGWLKFENTATLTTSGFNTTHQGWALNWSTCTSGGTTFYGGIKPAPYNAHNRTFTFSFWAKSQTSTPQTFELKLQNGSNSFSPTVGDQWQRVSVTCVRNSTVDANLDFRITQITTAAIAIYVRDFQVEEGTQATDYIATTTAASTPITEVLQVSTAPRVNLTTQGTVLPAVQGGQTVAYVNDYVIGLLAYEVTDGGTSSAFRNAVVGYTALPPAVHCLSWYAKAGNHSLLQLLTSGTISLGYANFDLNAGTVTQSANCTAAIQSIGNGWYRCSITFTPLATVSSGTGANFFAAFISSPTEARASGTVGSGRTIRLAAPLVEAGVSTPGAFFPTLADDGYADLHGYSYTRTGFKEEASATALVGFPAGIPGVVPGKGFYSRPSLINRLLQSQSYDNASWSKINVSVSPNTVLAPDGTQTADTVTISSTSHVLKQSVAVTAGEIVTISWWVKRGTATALRFYIEDGPGNLILAGDYIDEVHATDWTRIIKTFTVPAGVASVGFLPLLNGASTGTVHFWNADFIRGANLPDGGPVIPTTTGSATVAADVLKLVGQPAISATEDFVLLFRVTHPAAISPSGGYLATFTSNVTSDRLRCYMDIGNGGGGIEIMSGGVNQGALSVAGNSTGAGTRVIAVRRKGNIFSMATKRQDGVYVYGGENGFVTTGAALDHILIGSSEGSGAQLNAIMEAFTIKKGTFNDAALQTAVMAF